MRSMIAARAPIGAAQRRSTACHAHIHVREDAQLSDDHLVRFDEALEKLGKTELRQVGYKTVL
jgi:hypothetical protein